MAKLIENEMKGIQLKEGQTVLDVDGNEYLIEKGDVLQERTGDWRLPTKDELNLMYVNLHKKGVGGFANGSYWSSSEINSSNAWYQSFLNGYQYSGYEDGTKRVRTVWSFKLQEGEKYRIGQETETGYVFDIQGNTVFECKKQDEPKLMTWHDVMKKFGAQIKVKFLIEKRVIC